MREQSRLCFCQARILLLVEAAVGVKMVQNTSMSLKFPKTNLGEARSKGANREHSSKRIFGRVSAGLAEDGTAKSRTEGVFTHFGLLEQPTLATLAARCSLAFTVADKSKCEKAPCCDRETLLQNG